MTARAWGQRPFRISFWQFLMAVLLMALGFLVVTQSRAGRTLVEQPEVPSRNVYALATLLREERQARRTLEAQVEILRRQIADYERSSAQRRTITESMTRELEQLRLALGLRAVRGPGVTVSLKEPASRTPGATPVVVTYQDLVGVTNELWAAGAEAVSVNGQRVTAMSGFSQVGSTILVNLQRLSGPIVVSAIGDAENLENALNIRGGLVEGLRAIGLRVIIARHGRVEAPPYTGRITFQHARPVE